MGGSTLASRDAFKAGEAEEVEVMDGLSVRMKDPTWAHFRFFAEDIGRKMQGDDVDPFDPELLRLQVELVKKIVVEPDLSSLTVAEVTDSWNTKKWFALRDAVANHVVGNQGEGEEPDPSPETESPDLAVSP